MIEDEIFSDYNCFEFSLNESEFFVSDSGPLYNPIINHKIKRDSNFLIELTTVSVPNSTSNKSEHPEGTVRLNTDIVTLKNRYGYVANLYNIQPLSRKTNYSDKDSRTTEISYIGAVEINFNRNVEGKYLVEWLENVEDHLIWPGTVTNLKEETTSIKINFSDNSKEIKLPAKKSERNSYRCIYLNIDGIELYFFKSEKDKKDHLNKSGYIIYEGCPPEEKRKKIRDCLSFSLGRYLIYLGHSVCDKDWNLQYLMAESGYSFSMVAIKKTIQIPAPISNIYENMIEIEVFTRLALALINCYEKYNLGHIFSIYWNAVCAQEKVAAIHFGAAIEALQDSYTPVNKKLMTKTIWEDFHIAVKKIAQEKISDKDLLKDIQNKLSSLNQAPRKIVNQRFFDSLNIELGLSEKEAWDQRNDAAHGNECFDHIKLIKNNRVLRTLFNRVLLKITEGSDFYFDYYSIGKPCRNIKDCIPTGSFEC